MAVLHGYHGYCCKQHEDKAWDWHVHAMFFEQVLRLHWCFQMAFKWLSNGVQMPFKCLSNGFQMAFKCRSNAFQMAFKCLSNGYGNCKHILPVASWTHTLDSVQCSKWFYNSRLSLHSCHCMAVTAWLFCMATMATTASNMKTRLGTDMYMLCCMWVYLNLHDMCMIAWVLSSGFQVPFKWLANGFQMAMETASTFSQ